LSGERSRGAVDASVWQPLIFDPSTSRGADNLRELESSDCVWAVDDTLHLQLQDLVRARNPGEPLSDVELGTRIDAIVGTARAETYGRWIYYPWSGRLVRVLPEPEFRELRLDRNRNKITVAEQQRLRELTAAIVGLSVGNAVAVTVALEGVCGHLKLADFDRLGLSNLNRLRAGVHQIGVPKVVLAARQIFELDPYASLSLYTDGATHESLERLLTDEPKPNVVVDECDSIEMKFLLRERARLHGVPVLMETSDRGVVDIERFDLDPNRPVFHGLAGGTTASDIRVLDRADQVALILGVFGSRTISTRMAASMLEIGTTISTWPQLASEVALGGATMTAAVRRLGLGQQLPSGRMYVDVEQVLAAAADHPTPSHDPEASDEGHRGPMIRSQDAHDEEAMPEPVRFLVEHAIRAPSGGNSQPWSFSFDGETLWSMLDRDRSRTLLDVSSHASYLALGAAIENTSVAATHLGLSLDVEPFPHPADPTIVASLHLEQRDDRQHALVPSLTAVQQRATNRRLGDATPPTASELAELAAAAQGAHLELHIDRAALAEAAAVIGEADRIRLLCPTLHAEAMAEIRWTADDARQTCDGIDVATLELAAADISALQLIARPDVVSFLRSSGGGSALARMARQAIAGAGAVGLLRVDGNTPRAWLECGRALERIWLAATELGFGFQPMTVLVYMLEMLDQPHGVSFSAVERDVVRALGTRLDQLFAQQSGYPHALLFRLAKGVQPPSSRTWRRPLEQVLTFGRPPRDDVDVVSKRAVVGPE